MKKVGIVADNYKVTRFIKELAKKDFTDVEVLIFMDDVSNIKVNVPDDKINDVAKICKEVELHFKRAN